MPKWEVPAVLPDSAKLRTVKVELEGGLKAPSSGHMQWCIRKLFALPSRSGTIEAAAFQADNFIDACGHFPDDLWTAGTTELLRTKTFRPSPAEMVAVVEPKYGERQRMLERVNLMLRGGKPDQDAPAEKPIATRIGRLEHTRSIYARMNRMVDVNRIDREIAKERGEEIPAPSFEGENLNAERPPFVPDTSLTGRRCAELAAAKRQERVPNPTPGWDAAPEWRDVPEAV